MNLVVAVAESPTTVIENGFPGDVCHGVLRSVRRNLIELMS